MGWDSTVSIATCYGPDGPGFKSQWGEIFHTYPDRSWGAHPPSYTMGPGSFLGVKQPGHGVNCLPISSVEGKERVELYLYSHSVP